MFLVFPIGHDHEVYSRPWITYGVVLACAAMFIYGSVVDGRVADAAQRADTWLAAHPQDRIGPEVAQALPPRFRAAMVPNTAPSDDDDSVSGELEDRVLIVLDQLDRLPVWRFGFVPAKGQVSRMFSSMFVHADVWHLLGNMLFLVIAGGVLECFWLAWAYGALFVLSGMGGAALHALVDPSAAVESGYRVFRVETQQGALAEGFLVDRLGGGARLRMMGGIELSFSAAEIRRARFLNRSLMPDGLLDTLQERQVRDLLAHLRSDG